MEGGGNVDGFIHPVDFMAQAPSYCQGAASTLTMMAAQLDIPARLGETIDHSWVEVLIDGKWRFVENQPETFLDVVDPPISVWTYPKNGKQNRGYQPQSESGVVDALDRDAVMSGGLIDIIANPNDYGFVDGANRYSWFFDWSSPYVYGVDGEILGGEASLTFRPEVYSDSVFNYYACSYTDKHNSSQCGGVGRQFQVGEWYSSVWELAALYPDREDDLPYVCAKDGGSDTNIMYLTPIRDKAFNNKVMDQTKIFSGGGVRKQFYISEKDDIDAVYAILYLGPDAAVDHAIPDNGGDWYYKINGHQVYLRDINGFSRVVGKSNGIEDNYLGLGQRVLRYKMDLNHLNSAEQGCS
jgi:hypothetical protein